MAVQQDRESWFRQRLAGEAARGLYSPDGNVAKYLGGKPMAKNAKSSFADLNKQLDRQIKQAINDAVRGKQKGPSHAEIDDAVREGKTLVATTPSSCFSDVYYEDHVCVCIFAKDGYVWQMPMSTAEFLDFAQSDSLGQAWNAEYHGT